MAVIVIGVWLVTGSKSDPTPEPSSPAAENAVATPQVPVAAEAPVTPPPVVTASAPIASVSAPAQPFITEQSLTGAKYEVDKVVMEFAADKKWTVNGEAKAMWAIEGNRVKIYDDKGEEHFLDIKGDKLSFEGQPVELSR